MIKVSFDFDNTLALPEVQEYAQYLISIGIEVWITTARSKAIIKSSQRRLHSDLYDVALSLGIPDDKIMFTGCDYESKAEWLKNNGFVWHLDDDPYEHKEISRLCATIPINVEWLYWKESCDEYIRLLDY
jgi:hypothetical protein